MTASTGCSAGLRQTRTIRVQQQARTHLGERVGRSRIAVTHPRPPSAMLSGCSRHWSSDIRPSTIALACGATWSIGLKSLPRWMRDAVILVAAAVQPPSKTPIASIARRLDRRDVIERHNACGFVMYILQNPCFHGKMLNICRSCGYENNMSSGNDARFMPSEVEENHQRLVKRDVCFRRFGFDTQASIDFVLVHTLPLQTSVLELATDKGRFLSRPGAARPEHRHDSDQRF